MAAPLLRSFVFYRFKYQTWALEEFLHCDSQGLNSSDLSSNVNSCLHLKQVNVSKMSSSHPYASVTPSNLVPKDVDIPMAQPIAARIAMIIPGDEREFRETVLFSSNPKGSSMHLMASTIHSHSSY